VAVEAVDDELRRLFDDVDAEPPSYDALADIRERSRYLDTTVDIDADELRIRLTEAGEEVAMPDTGGVQAAGGSAHDTALRQIEEELTALGFTVSILAQDGSEKPDATASHPDVADRFAIEVETTTPENPAKVLTNLRKAQEAGDIPLFVVRPGNDETEWADRVDGILTPPVRPPEWRDEGSTRPTRISRSTAERPKKGVTAVRPANGDENRIQNIWQRDDDEIVLVVMPAERNTTVSRRFRPSRRIACQPSTATTTLPTSTSYTSTVSNTSTSRNRRSRMTGVRIKKPFVPEAELPVPDYTRSTYSIVILHDEAESVVYEDGEKRPLSAITDGSLHPASSGSAAADEPPVRPTRQMGRSKRSRKTNRHRRSNRSSTNILSKTQMKPCRKMRRYSASTTTGQRHMASTSR